MWEQNEKWRKEFGADDIAAYVFSALSWMIHSTVAASAECIEVVMEGHVK